MPELVKQIRVYEILSTRKASDLSGSVLLEWTALGWLRWLILFLHIRESHSRLDWLLITSHSAVLVSNSDETQWWTKDYERLVEGMLQ